MTYARAVAASRPGTLRWVQLLVGIICMVMIANLQYGWTLFVNPIDQKYHWGRAAIQVAFTIFVLTETWLVPVEGWLVDRFGPKIVVLVGGFLVAIAWVLNSVADDLWTLYIAAAIGGIGAGAVYGTSMGNALKWFPDRRGLAAGLTAAGFGAGSALTIIPIQGMIQSSGYQATFLWFGIGQGIVVAALSLLLRAPQPGEAPASTRVQQSARSSASPCCSPDAVLPASEMARSPRLHATSPEPPRIPPPPRGDWGDALPATVAVLHDRLVGTQVECGDERSGAVGGRQGESLPAASREPQGRVLQLRLWRGERVAYSGFTN